MNPNHLEKPDRYLWEFGRFHGINELRGRSDGNHSVYNKIRQEFIHSMGFKLMPPKENQYEIIELNFHAFKEFVSEKYGRKVLVYCGKEIFRFRTSGKVLAKCLLDWRLDRKENGRYYCETCKCWHLTSKSY